MKNTVHPLEDKPWPDARRLMWIVVAAVLLRLIWALLIPVVPLSDSAGYDIFARNLVEHGVFGWTPEQPFAFWPPGTSFLYAAMYWVFGYGHTSLIVLHILISVGLILTSARVAHRFYGEDAALWCGTLLAVWPTLIMFTTILASELLFALLTVAALDAWTARSGSAWRRGVLAGLLLGMAALVRPQALLLPGVYGLALVLSSPNPRQVLGLQLRTALMSGLVMAVLIAPWAWRNYQLYDEFVLISTNGGITLWMGNTPGTGGSHMNVPASIAELPDNEQARVLGAMAREYILADPAAFAMRAVRKVFLLYSNESIGVGWNSEGIAQRFGEASVLWFKRFTQVTWAALFLMSLYGVWVLLRREGAWRLLVSPVMLTVLFYTAIHSVVVSQDRYHLNFAGQIAMFFGIGMASLAHRRGRAPSPPRTAHEPRRALHPH
ncbi:ArnT family glycosyltransferase [Caldimonas caldifontis]|nr:glycosyltransferase family 39 protein [Caldimonas caldifontis]